MQRLTWSGIAIHGGNLPACLASHECVRLPADFAEKLYSVTAVGTTVIITEGRSAASAETSNVDVLLTGATGAPASTRQFPMGAAKGAGARCQSSLAQPINMPTQYRNGVQIGRASFDLGGRVRGSHVYSALATFEADARRDWLVSRASAGRKRQTSRPSRRAAASRQGSSPRCAPRSCRGSTLIVTDMPVSRRSHSSSGFGIMTADDAL